jgi:hypothetical protein
MIGGSYAVYKLTQHDLNRIEQETGKSAENMTEEELKIAMKNLGIKKMELTADDEIQIDKITAEDNSDTSKFCTYCGAPLEFNARFCPKCGQQV